LSSSTFSWLDTTQTGMPPPLRTSCDGEAAEAAGRPQIRTMSPCFIPPAFWLTSIR
jgi:hypothetical protein